MQKQQEQSGFMSNSRDSLNVLYFFATAHSACFWPFLRRGFGHRAFGLSGLVASAMILVVAAEANAPSMMAYFWAWVVTTLWHRARSMWMWRRGVPIHSLYQGWPWLALKLPFLKSETKAKNVVEPFICLLGGALLLPVSHPLGTFVMVGFFSLLITRGIQSQITLTHVARMRDAAIEQRQLAEQVRAGEL